MVAAKPFRGKTLLSARRWQQLSGRRPAPCYQARCHCYFRRYVIASRTMYRAQPFEQPVIAAHVENARQWQFEVGFVGP